MQSQEAVIARTEVSDENAEEFLARLSSSPVLRALSAGWTTSQDKSYLLPILAGVHSVLLAKPGRKALHLEGENSSAYGAVLVGEHQFQRYGSLLRTTRSAALEEQAMPSFARHFCHRVSFLHEGANAQVACALIRWTVSISDRVLRAAEVAIERASDSTSVARGRGDTGLSMESDAVMKAMGGHAAIASLQSLYLEFLADLDSAMRFKRLHSHADRIQSRASLECAEEPPRPLYPGSGEIMCTEADEDRDIEFTVERYPCTAEVLDPRVVRIPAGKRNNRHKHAHETLFYFISGTGEILVGETWVQVKPGDAVFSPRWAVHQTHNTGQEELVLLAITDYYLTSQVYVGRYDKI